MLLERNQVLVGIIFALLLGVGTVGAILIDRSVIAGGADVTAFFHDVAGLESGDSVLVAGVRSGTVESVSLEGGLGKAVLRIEEPMPSDSRAEIVLQNFLGKRAVSVVAGDRWDDPFETGDTIPVDRTTTPIDYAELNEESAKLLDESDVGALRELVSSVADVTEGQRDEVDELLRGLQRITEVVADKKDDLERVIDRSEEVFGTLAEEDEELVRIIDAFGSTLDRLVERREELVELLQGTARSSNLTADLVAEEREQLDRVLRELREDLGILDRHQVDLAHMFAYGGASFEGYANIGVSGERDNPYWANILGQSVAGIGLDSILGCDGAVDSFLDEVLGEDPRSCEEQSEQTNDEAAGGDGERGGAATPANAGLRGFFRLHGGVR